MKLSLLLATMAVAAEAQDKTLLEIVAETDALSTLNAAVGASSIVPPLADKTTVFAPSNAAFEALDTVVSNVVAHLTVDNEYNQGILDKVLLAHVINNGGDAITSADVLAEIPETGDTLTVTTLNGDIVLTRVSESEISVAAVGGVDTHALLDLSLVDIEATNGIAHVTGGVIVPANIPTQTLLGAVANAEGLEVLAEAATEQGFATAAGLGAPGTLTAFAPTDAAFVTTLEALGIDKDALLASPRLNRILGCHAVVGTAVTREAFANLPEDAIIDTAECSVPKSLVSAIGDEVLTLNGIAHVVDAVIAPTVGSLAKGTPALSTLVTALGAAGLGDAFDSVLGDDATVFAPVNDAFAAAGVAPAVDFLLAETEYAKGLLTEVLTHHVLADARVLSGDLTEGQEIEVMNGQKITYAGGKFTSAAGTEAGLVVADVKGVNGVAHVIDGVLLPAGVTYKSILAEIAGKGEGYGTIVAALGAASATEMFGEASIDAKAAYTVFVPSDAAFTAVLEALGITLDDLVADKDLLTTVLNAHVIAEPLDSVKLTEAGKYTAASGEEITLDRVTLSDEIDVKTLNGFVHYVDAVIVPPSLDAPATPTMSPTASPVVSGETPEPDTAGPTASPTMSPEARSDDSPDDSVAPEAPNSATTMGAAMTLAVLALANMF